MQNKGTITIVSVIVTSLAFILIPHQYALNLLFALMIFVALSMATIWLSRALVVLFGDVDKLPVKIIWIVLLGIGLVLVNGTIYTYSVAGGIVLLYVILVLVKYIKIKKQVRSVQRKQERPV